MVLFYSILGFCWITFGIIKKDTAAIACAMCCFIFAKQHEKGE